MLWARHRGPLAADLHHLHGIRLRNIRETDWSVTEIAEFAANLPPESAVARAADPDRWMLSADTYLLREIEHDLRVLAWQSTTDAASKQPKGYPVPRALTPDEAEAQKPKQEYDVCTIDEMDEFLGWG